MELKVVQYRHPVVEIPLQKMAGSEAIHKDCLALTQK